MDCPRCKQRLDAQNPICKNCGYDLSTAPWVLLTREYPPNDLIVDSLLTSCDIPHKMIRHDIPQMPVTIGPLAEVKFLIPEQILAETHALLREIDEEPDSRL